MEQTEQADAANASFPSFDALLAAFIMASESTENVDRQAWIEQHSNFSTQLQDYFAALDAVSQRTKCFRQPVRAASSQAFGSYRLLEQIGRGGMGVVYRALHTPLDRVVAIKLITHGGGFDSLERRRFQNEAELASMLDHPNIVPVYDFGAHEGQFYLAMKLVEGTSLAEWPDLHADQSKTAHNFRQIQRRAASILLTVARAVHHAHQRGILHRDLKPSNILLDVSQTPYIADFGLAKNLASDLELTQTNLMLGTPSYMAPEQVKPVRPKFDIKTRQPNSITTATDVYGLGAILCYLLSGAPPFRGSSLHETLAMVCNTEFAPLRKQNYAIDRDLDAICQKCLQKVPAHRYSSAADLADDLERWLDGKPITARPLRAPVRAWRWCRRNAIVASMITLICVLAVLSVVSLSLGYLTANRARDEAIHQRRTALANLRAVVAEINDLENRRPDLEDLRLELLERIQQQLAPMLTDSIHGTLADETNFWLEIDAGNVKKWQGQPSSAKLNFLRAMDIAERIPENARQLRMRLKSFALSYLGDVDLNFGERQTAAEKFEQVLAIRQELARRDPTNEALADEALAHLKFATALLALGHQEKLASYFETSASHAQAALSIFGRLTEAEPDNIWHARFIGYGYENLSQTALARKRWDECLKNCRLGLECLKGAQLRLPQYALVLDWHICVAYDRQFDCGMMIGQYDFAEQAAEASLALREQLARFNPQALSVRWQPILSLWQLTASQMRRGDLQAARQNLERAQAEIEEFLAILGTRREMQADLVHTHSRLVDAALPYPELDEVTVRLSHKRTELLRKLLADKETADNADLMYWTIVERAQLHMLRGEWTLAEESLASAADYLHSSHMVPKPTEAEACLQAHTMLLQQARTSDDVSAFDGAALIDLVQSPCVLVRLRLHFSQQGDTDSLERLALRLWSCSDEHYRKQAAVECLQTASDLAHSPERQRELRAQATQRIAELQDFYRMTD